MFNGAPLGYVHPRIRSLNLIRRFNSAHDAELI